MYFILGFGITRVIYFYSPRKPMLYFVLPLLFADVVIIVDVDDIKDKEINELIDKLPKFKNPYGTGN